MPIKASNNGKTLPAKLVFSRSLEYFYKMAKEEITRASGFWHDDEVKWILTVPAIWGDRAREFMRDAANEVIIQIDILYFECLIGCELQELPLMLLLACWICQAI